MVELEKKYTPSSRRFGVVNWIGAWSLYKKEVLRFLIVMGQTILGPITTAGLFLLACAKLFMDVSKAAIFFKITC